jgi:hypothetical protein
MYQIKRRFDCWNLLWIQQPGRIAEQIKPQIAARLEPKLTDETRFQWWPSSDGALYTPLTRAERRRKLAQQKRNAERRRRTAAGLNSRHGWSGHWQRR